MNPDLGRCGVSWSKYNVRLRNFTRLFGTHSVEESNSEPREIIDSKLLHFSSKPNAAVEDAKRTNNVKIQTMREKNFQLQPYGAVSSA